MKKIIIAALLLSTFAVKAQTIDLRNKIEVSGTAEAEVTPDIIYFSISLKEYMDGRNRVSIDVLEGQLQKAVQEAGIPKEDFMIQDVSGYISYQKRRDPNFLAGKQYRIKFHDLNKVNQILSSVDPKGLVNTNIESSEYSKIIELKRELKIKALVAARDKATSLLNAIGEKLGGAIEIIEEDNNYTPAARSMMANTLMNVNTLVETSSPDQDINFTKIKLTFQIKAVFEIVK